MSATEPNRPELPPSREELAVAPTQALRPDEPSSELANLLDDYLAELQSGRQPDRAKLMAEHPELATQLEQCLSGIEFIHRVSGPATKSGMPTQLGDFRIVREVGRGGMGVVYEAEQISLKRRVALKVLRFGAASDTEAMQRFQREAETVAGLHHTNIVPIFAIGCEQGVNYYAMQFIEGRSLAEGQGLRGKGKGSGSLSSPSPLSPHPSACVANWGLQAAEALAHAHQRGVIHRDIKPSNLILDPDGRIWLTDFGLAKRMDDVSLSIAGAILGTPRYMSPEQAASAKRPVDHRTDIYSLGATLYELATGRPLFDADSPHAVITQILTSEPPAPRVVCPGLHRDFETIILKCLAKEPERRYATAQALADDLRAFVEGRAIKARRSTLAEQAARWFKQQKRSVGVAAAAVAATVLIVIGSLIAWQMHTQAMLGYLTLNTSRDGAERADVAEVLRADNDEPVGSPFTLPTKEPLALVEGTYRLRLTAPGKVSQTYLFDIAAGAQQTQEVGLVNETVGYAIPLLSPVGVELSGKALAAGRDELPAASAVPLSQSEPRLFVGPQDSSKPTLRCYSGNSAPGWKPDGSRTAEVTPLWEADWRLETPDVVSFLKLPDDREAWKVLPAQTDVFAWQQVLAWFDSSWFRNGTPPKVLQPARDINGDGVEDVIWVAPTLANQAAGAFGPGPLTPKAAVLVAASGKDGKPLWWFRPQDSKGAACKLGTAPVWCGDVIVAVVRSVHDTDSRIEAVSPTTGESLWRHNAGAVGWSWLTTATIDGKPSVIAVIQDRLFVLDAATGEPKLGTPAYLDWSDSGKIVVKPEDSTGLHKGTVLLADLRFAELDGDGVPEVLLSVFVKDERVDVVALSVTRREALWQVESSVKVGPHDPFQGTLPWPFVADFDDDGRAEVIVPNHSGYQIRSWTGCRVLNGATGDLRWERRYPVRRAGTNTRMQSDRYVLGPDLDGDGLCELFLASIRSEYGPVQFGSAPAYHYEQYFLYVDGFSGRDGSSVWWQRIPLGMSEYAAWTGTVGEMLWWGSANAISRNALESGSKSGHTLASGKPDASAFRLIIPVHRHPDTQADGGTHSIYFLSAETGRLEHQADDVALPQLVDWNNDGLDDLAVFVPDDPREFASAHNWPYKPSGKFVVLRGSPPEAFRRLDRWAEEQDFDGDGIAELSQPMGGMGVDYAVQIASGRDGLIQSRWKTEWPETPRTQTVGDIQSFPAPLGDFDGDGLADLLLTSEGSFHDFDAQAIVRTGRVPLLVQAISGKSGKRVWGGPSLPLPEDLRPTSADENAEPWLSMRLSQIRPTLMQAVDVDGDGRPELLQSLGLFGYRLPKSGGDRPVEHQQQYVALTDGRDGSLRWAEPLTEFVQGNSWWYSAEEFQLDAAHDLDADGTRDVVIVIPHRDEQGWWSGTLQARNGRDGKLLWPAHEIDGKWIGSRGIKSPRIGDLDGDGRPEIVLYETIQPQLRALRGDTGKTLWTWKATQNLSPNSIVPEVVLVARSPVAPRQESRTSTDADRANDANRSPESISRNALASGSDDSQPDASTFRLKSGQPKQRSVAVTINETGNQWELVLLDHTGQVVERGPYRSNQIWSHDLDGDGGEELLRVGDNNNKLLATRGLHDLLWIWSPPPSGYDISRFDRTADGRAIVVTASSDSLTLLDGPTGKPLGRTFKSTNSSSHDGLRLLNVKHADIAKRLENSRFLTRVGDGSQAFNHVVSRAVLPTDDDGRYAVRRLSLRESTPYRGAKGNSDPRLVRPLMWGTTPEHWAATRAGIFKDVLLAIGLSLIVVLIPYWLIRAGILRRNVGRWRVALIGCGVILFLGSLSLIRFPLPGSQWRDVPWALPFVLAIGGLPILMFPTALLQALAGGEWRRVRRLLGSTLILALVLTALHLAVDLSSKPPEQHYSWFGWWWIFVIGAYFTGAGLVVWRAFGPGVGWLWSIARRKPARHG